MVLKVGAGGLGHNSPFGRSRPRLPRLLYNIKRMAGSGLRVLSRKKTTSAFADVVLKVGAGGLEPPEPVRAIDLQSIAIAAMRRSRY